VTLLTRARRKFLGERGGVKVGGDIVDERRVVKIQMDLALEAAERLGDKEW